MLSPVPGSRAGTGLSCRLLDHVDRSQRRRVEGSCLASAAGHCPSPVNVPARSLSWLITVLAGRCPGRSLSQPVTVPAQLLSQPRHCLSRSLSQLVAIPAQLLFQPGPCPSLVTVLAGRCLNQWLSWLISVPAGRCPTWSLSHSGTVPASHYPSWSLSRPGRCGQASRGDEAWYPTVPAGPAVP